MIKATIDGNTLQFDEGISILKACRSIDQDIPTLCNDQRLSLNRVTSPYRDRYVKSPEYKETAEQIHTQ